MTFPHLETASVFINQSAGDSENNASGCKSSPSIRPVCVLRTANPDGQDTFPLSPAGKLYNRTPRRHFGGYLFCDISGFTDMVERFSSQGDLGIERVSSVLSQLFKSLADVIDAYCGDIIKYAGDALLVFFPARGTHDMRSAVWRMCSAAIKLHLALATVCDTFSDVVLKIKVGCGAGEMWAMHIGGEDNRYEYIFAGQPVSQAVDAESFASPGSVIVTSNILAILDDQSPQATPIDDRKIFYRLNRLSFWPTDMVEPVLYFPINVNNLSFGLQVALMNSYVAGRLTDTLDLGKDLVHQVSEFRFVTVLFCSIRHKNAYQWPTSADMVSKAANEVFKLLKMTGGDINKALVDDKGFVILGAFGLPFYSHEDDQLRAISCAVKIAQVIREMGLVSSIGVTSGRCYCGIVGSVSRREFTMIGDTVNTAARLMQFLQKRHSQCYLECDDSNVMDFVDV